MDIWDVSTLLVRRWPVSVPLLLLTAAATVLIALNVRPDYVGTTHVSLLPPTMQRNAAQGQTLWVNPWDTERLTNAVIVRLNTKSLADQLEGEGFKGTWGAGLEEQYRSVIRIEVTAPTAAQARSTTSRLLREVDDEVTRQQARYPNLGPDDKITITRFDSGDEVEAATEKAWRAIVVVAVGGVLLTALVSVSADAVLRRRTRPWAGIVGVSAPPVPAHQTAEQGSAKIGAPPAASADTDATQPVVITNVPLPMPVAGAIPATQIGPGRSPAREQLAGSGRSTPSPDDSTVVLPFSNAPWAERQKTAAFGEAEAGKAAEIAQL
jgi:hypothetical protein